MAEKFISAKEYALSMKKIDPPRSEYADGFKAGVNITTEHFVLKILELERQIAFLERVLDNISKGEKQ